MAGKRFKDTEKKLNIKKVLLILMIPVVIAGGYFGYKELPRFLETYNVTRVATIGYYPYKNEEGKLVEVLEEGYYSLEEINNFLSSQSDEFVYISKDIEKLNDSLLEGSKNNDMVRAANVIKIYDSLEDVDCYNMKPQYLRKTEAERELENDKNK